MDLGVRFAGNCSEFAITRIKSGVNNFLRKLRVFSIGSLVKIYPFYPLRVTVNHLQKKPIPDTRLTLRV